MQKQLKKAFSSIIKYPKIANKKRLIDSVYNSTNYNIQKRESFLTIITDDIGFATIQNNKIDKKINAIKQIGVKPWEIPLNNNNNFYSPQWTCNKKIIKNIKNNVLVKGKNNFYTLNIDNHRKFFKKETESIFSSYSTAKNYKFKNELKKKYAPLDAKTENLLFNTRKLCFNNIMLDLLQKESLKINLKEIGYKDALQKEDIILNKDMKNFENFKEQENLKLKNLENELFRKISENGAIFELVKKYSHEHKMILDLIKRYLKNIIKLRNYALSIYKILGIDSTSLSKYDLGESKLKSLSLKETEIEQIIKKIVWQAQRLFDQNFDDIIEELYSDPLKIYNAVINKENMILNLLTEKENIIFESEISIKDFKKEIELYENKYNNYMNEYIMYLEEFEIEMKKIQLIEPNKKTYEFHNYLIKLFYEVKKCLLNEEKQKKYYKGSFVYINLVIPCLKELQKKELKINRLIKEMEFYEKNDKKLFYKYVYGTKLDNKEKKFIEEKEAMKEKEIEKKERILKKINQIIIKGKYKYKLPNSINKIKSFSNDLKYNKKNNNI